MKKRKSEAEITGFAMGTYNFLGTVRTFIAAGEVCSLGAVLVCDYIGYIGDRQTTDIQKVSKWLCHLVFLKLKTILKVFF